MHYQIYQKFDWLMFLQPTSPLRNAIDMNKIFEFCQKCKASSAVSVSKLESLKDNKANNSNLIYRISEDFHLSSLKKKFF